jgi:NADH:ubiquinone oxidoreductase subunit 6 (subunit J)
MIETLLFAKFALVSVLAAAGVLFAPNIVYAAISLLVVFACVAGFFLLNNADFLAIAQILVYAVGLTIIILFGLMFTGTQAFAPVIGQRVRQWSAAGIALVVSTVLAVAAGQMAQKFQIRPASSALVAQYQQEGSIRLIGQLLYGKYVLPFELASLLLLGAMVGAIVIAKKQMTVVEEVAGSIKFGLVDGVTPHGARQWRSEFAKLDTSPLHPVALSSTSSDAPPSENPAVVVASVGGQS